jgi:hypothetical protein
MTNEEKIIEAIKYRMQLAEKYKMKDYTDGYLAACRHILDIPELEQFLATPTGKDK